MKSIIIAIAIIIVYILFIIINRKQGIVKDTGFYKILLLSIGLISFLISFFFITYTNFSECSWNFIFKHFGISSMMLILYLYIIQGFSLGVKVLKKGKDNKYYRIKSAIDFMMYGNEIKIVINDAPDINSDDNDDGKCDSITYKKKFKNQRKSYFITNNSGSLNFSHENEDDFNCVNDILMKAEKHANSSTIEALLVYLIYIFVIFFILILYKWKDRKDEKKYNENEDNYLEHNLIQNTNGEWSYKCDLENVNIFFDIIGLIMLVIILIKGKQMNHYECIFSCIKYITYSCFVGIVLGPIVNVNIIILI